MDVAADLAYSWELHQVGESMPLSMSRVYVDRTDKVQ